MKTPSNQAPSWKSPRSLLAIAAAASSLFGVSALHAQDNGVEPALLFNNNGNQIYVDDGVTVSAGADIEFTAWLFPTGWGVVNGNPALWRNGPLSNGSSFMIFQTATGRPWIRWNGADILRPLSGYGVPLNEWIQVRFVVTSAASAEFWTRGPGEEWVLRHSNSHSAATAQFTIHRYGWQTGNNQQRKIRVIAVAGNEVLRFADPARAVLPPAFPAMPDRFAGYGRSWRTTASASRKFRRKTDR